MNSGERFAVLIDSNGIPLTYPNLYTMIYLRNRGHSVNTIVAVLEDIELLYHIFHKLEIDIDKRIEDKKFLNLSEIEAITNLANFKRNYLLARKSNRKILSLPNLKNKEHIRAKFVLKNDYVSKDLIYRRLTNFADYLHWLEVYRSPSSITTTLKVLKNRRPKKAIDQHGDYKSFDQEQLEKILQVVNPSNTECIWTSKFLSYRNELIILLFRDLGCRKGELLNIKVTDIVIKNGVSYINIKRNPNDKMDPRLNQPLVKTLSRSLAIRSELKKKVENYILYYRSTIPKAELSDFLIISDQGKPLSISGLDKIFVQISEKVSFRVHAHAFRHTWNDKYTDKASSYISSGKISEDKLERDRAYLMGWIPGSQSARRYSKRAEDRRAIEIGLQIQKNFGEEDE